MPKTTWKKWKNGGVHPWRPLISYWHNNYGNICWPWTSIGKILKKWKKKFRGGVHPDAPSYLIYIVTMVTYHWPWTSTWSGFRLPPDWSVGRCTRRCLGDAQAQTSVPVPRAAPSSNRLVSIATEPRGRLETSSLNQGHKGQGQTKMTKVKVKPIWQRSRLN